MKKLIFLVFVLLIGCASVMTQEQMARKGVVVLPEKKDMIYDKSLQFIMVSFQSSEGITQYHNQKAGKIIEKGWIRAQGWSIELTLIIDVYDCISEITVMPKSWSAGSPIYNTEYKSYKIEGELLKIIEAYKQFMTGTPKS